MSEATNFLGGLLGRVVDTAANDYLRRRDPVPAPVASPTDAPRIAPVANGLPAVAGSPGVASFWPMPPVVWVVLALGLAGGAFYAMKRK